MCSLEAGLTKSRARVVRSTPATANVSYRESWRSVAGQIEPVVGRWDGNRLGSAIFCLLPEPCSGHLNGWFTSKTAQCATRLLAKADVTEDQGSRQQCDKSPSVSYSREQTHAYAPLRPSSRRSHGLQAVTRCRFGGPAIDATFFPQRLGVDCLATSQESPA